MEDPRLLLHFSSLEKFNEELGKGTINPNKHFCVIKKEKLIWIRGQFYADNIKLENISSFYNDWEISQVNDSNITITLKGKMWNNTSRTWDSITKPLIINAATKTIAGVMTASDKIKLDETLPNEIASCRAIEGQSGPTYTPNSGSNYINSATNLNDADILLDAQIKSLADSISEEVNNRNNAINGLNSEKEDNSEHVKVKVVQKAGKIDSITVSEEDIASANALKTHIDNTTIHVTQADKNNWNSKQSAIEDLDDIRSKANNGQSAYDWGNHADAGYVTSSGVTSVATSGSDHITLTGGVITSTGTITAGVESGYSIPSDTDQASWTAKQDSISDLADIRSNASLGATANSWGNHADAGYSKSDTTYSFNNGTTKGTFIVTPSNGTAKTVSVGNAANLALLNTAQTWTAYQDFTSGAGNSGSDIRYKENIKSYPDILDKVNELDIIEYTWNKEGETKKDTFGISAQQLEKLGFQNMVHTREDNDTKWVEYDRFGVIALKAIQELTNIINKQQIEINLLKSKLS